MLPKDLLICLQLRRKLLPDSLQLGWALGATDITTSLHHATNRCWSYRARRARLGRPTIRASPLGTWQLLSRTDSSAAGVKPADGPLGADPIAWIINDTRGHVAAQLMARDRTKPAVSTPTVSPPDPNNSAASDGYDAYFGTYEVDAARHTVTHHLLAALSPEDVGRTLKRSFFLRGDTLIIAFDTRRVDGTSVTRRVVWRRIAP